MALHPGARWQPAAWSDLPGWGTDRTREAWLALQRSCERVPAEVQRAAPAWPRLCQAALRHQPADDAATRAWLTERLLPYRVLPLDAGAADEGLATGYFEPQIDASRTPRAAMRTPLYAPPADLATRKPWFTRAQIDTLPAAQAALRGREIAYVADPLDALLLQIQGSGRLRLAGADGRVQSVRLAFAGHNDQPYQSIGRWLIDQGELKPGEASWPAIRDWARRNPRRVPELLAANPRVVFFREEPLTDANARPARRAGRGAGARALDRGGPEERALRHPRLARHHRAADRHAAAPPGAGAGHRRRDHRRGARRLLLGLGRARGAAGRAHEAAAAHVGAVAQVSRAPAGAAQCAIRGQSMFSARPAITNAAAAIFQAGNASPSNSAEAPMPNTGTSKASGVTVAAGCRASSQAHAP